MKKLLLFIAIGLSVFAFQSCDNDKKTEDKVITTSEVPAPVQTAFSAKYSTAADIKWEDAHEDNEKTYKVKFTVDGKKMKAEYDAKGGLVKEGEDD